MGAVEEGGKVASGIIESLKAQPALLAMILSNIMLLVFLFYAQRQFFNERATFLESEKQVRDILSRCVVTPPKVSFPPLKPLVDSNEDNR